MPRPPLIVLKFGGSVLLDESRLRIAVHEIYRWRREGRRVLAVVSALAGTTDALLDRCRRLSGRPSAYAEAAVVACGELESAALLGVHLDRAGVPAAVLSPGAASLRAAGPADDAIPVSLDRETIHAALDRDGVVVFPGFIATDAHGRTVTLGRGGSDLTALFLAHELGADRCRLIKDVDGLYDGDPAKIAATGGGPKRYAAATYADALATDGSIIQHKAVRFAQRHGVRFELGRVNGTDPTHIGAPRTRVADGLDTPRRLRVALLGLGTVGGGVLDLVRQLPELFEVGGVAVRDATRQRPALEGTITPTDDATALAGSGVDVVVETIGGVEIAAVAAHCALDGGASIVTANKSLLAERAGWLGSAACPSGASVLGGAAVGGAAPVLERIACGRDRITGVRGVLNGTCNFVLECIGRGRMFDDAIAEAQRLGFAEADPARDLDGRDSVDKLRVIAESLGIDRDRIQCGAITPINGGTIAAAACRNGQRLRQIATLDRNGRIEVRIEPVGPGDALFELPGEWNAVELRFADGSTEVVRGKGAGRWPTAEAVLGDLLELSRSACAGVAVDHERGECGEVVAIGEAVAHD